MLYTDNIGLKKPAYSDPADIADINENSDIIDREFGNRYLKSETYSVEQANNAIAQAIEALPNGLVYRGAVNYYKDLPTANNELGDTYSVKYQGETGTTADGNEYAWGEYDGALQWIKLGVNAYTKKEIDEQHQEIKSDILSAQNQIDTQTLITTSGEANSKNWYRAFEVSQKGAVRTGIILINRGYSNGLPEQYILSINIGYYANKINLISRFIEKDSNNVGRAYIDKIRIVRAISSPSKNNCYIDIHYNADLLNVIYASILANTTNSEAFFPVDFTVAEIPEGYTSYEFDLTGKDIFERLTALETSLAQTE